MGFGVFRLRPRRECCIIRWRKTKEREMNAKHTPGPWATNIEVETFDGARLDATVYINHGSGKGGEICTFRHDPDDGLDLNDAEQIANANLVAAAPELLAALQDILDAYHGLTLGRQNTEWEGRLKVATRIAIAKAKGSK